MDKVTARLAVYAKRIGSLRDDLLFDEPESREPFDRSGGGMSVQFFLAGLAQLEMAERMMKLAALQWQEEQEQ